jgi:hypothetical protein
VTPGSKGATNPLTAASVAGTLGALAMQKVMSSAHVMGESGPEAFTGNLLDRSEASTDDHTEDNVGRPRPRAPLPPLKGSASPWLEEFDSHAREWGRLFSETGDDRQMHRGLRRERCLASRDPAASHESFSRRRGGRRAIPQPSPHRRTPRMPAARRSNPSGGPSTCPDTQIRQRGRPRRSPAG